MKYHDTLVWVLKNGKRKVVFYVLFGKSIGRSRRLYVLMVVIVFAREILLCTVSSRVQRIEVERLACCT